MNIVGIGTDLVAIARIKKIWQRFGLAFANRILTQKELEDLAAIRDPIHFLAKRYAAKEAVAKALGVGFRPQGVRLTEIGVANNKLGCPYLLFTGQTAELIQERKVNHSQISLSDEKEYALAFVILISS